MTSKKKATAKNKPQEAAPSLEQRLAIIEEAIDRLPVTRPRKLEEFAEWWTKFGLPEVMAFHEVRTDTAAIWLLRWNYSSGQPGGELQIDHAVIPADDSQPPRLGSRVIRGRRYDKLFRMAVFQASCDALECLKDWRRMLSAGQKTDPKKKNSPDSSRPIPPEAWTAFNYQKQMKRDGRKCTKDQALDYAIGPHRRKGRDYLKKQMKRCETTKPPRKRRTKSGL